ncbi:MAG TPA: transposase, partial [Tichowtungia sp.]|nr:transposase [Tichowtungia sp.]
RFAHTLGFRIDSATYTAIKAHASDLAKISMERIEHEFSRILTESLRPGEAVKELVELGLMPHIIPEILPMVGQEQPPQFHPEGDVFEHTVLMLNLMDRQAGMPASQDVEQTSQSAHSSLNNRQAGMPASQDVEQASLPAHPFRPIQQGDSLQQSRRRLPHWQQKNRIYFVTFRLADSIAQQKLNQWREEVSHLCETKRNQEYRRKCDDWLDKGYGNCILKNPPAAEIVEQTLFHFDGDRYQLGDYVIMPNHVHLIVKPADEQHLSAILHSWKSFSAQQINRQLGRKGVVWMDESFDHIIRREPSFIKYQTYIRNNPAKAKLPAGSYRLGAGTLSREQAEMPAPPVAQASLPASFKKMLAYTVLLHDVGKPDTAFMGEDRIRFHGHETHGAKMAEAILRRLRLPVKEIRQIVTAIAGHMRFKDVQKMNKSTLRKLMGAETFDLELELHRVDCAGSHGLLDNYEFLLQKAEEIENEPVLPERWVTGKDLRELGVEPGPHLGELLQKAYDAQLEGRIKTRKELLDWLTDSL